MAEGSFVASGLREQPRARVYSVEGASEEQLKWAREEIQRAHGDPSYSIVTDLPIEWIDVPQGAIVLAEQANEEELEELRMELCIGWENPAHLIVVSYMIGILGHPAAEFPPSPQMIVE